MKMFKQLALGMLFALAVSGLNAEEQISEVEPFSQAELEQILAPIALYPDTVLSHILIAATYPLEVIQAERWTQKNSDITGSNAVEAVENENWDPSIKALVAFPQVLKRLSENLEWTQKLGDAFLQDEEKLLASVQSLRVRAYESGNLDKMDKVSVIREDDSIVIEPIEREVVYVPYYDTRSVYGPWYWSHYPPVYWSSPYYASNYYGNHSSPFYWGPRVHVSFGFFFNSFQWDNYHVVRIPSQYYRPRHYYSRNQIASHQYATRWTHNPTHRRGVSYRSVTVSNRYRSTRPSRAEIQTHRSDRKYSNKDTRANRDFDRVNPKKTNKKNVVRTSPRNTRIATPDRIKRELSDGRISIKERKNRPTNHKPAKQTKSTKKQDRSKTITRQPRVKSDTTTPKRSPEGKKQTNERQAPHEQKVQPQSNSKETSHRSTQSSSRSSHKSSSQRSSRDRSSNSSRSNRSSKSRERKH